MPVVSQIYDYMSTIFSAASQCGVQCRELIYIERLMEKSGVELLADNWRPILLCGLLLASKVWQDVNPWNIEFANVLSDFSLDSINRLERTFLKHLQYSLNISGKVYARYYFALRSLAEKRNFRQRYNHMMISRNAPNSSQVEERLRTSVLSCSKVTEYVCRRAV